jgi:hypothetical protein
VAGARAACNYMLRCLELKGKYIWWDDFRTPTDVHAQLAKAGKAKIVRISYGFSSTPVGRKPVIFLLFSGLRP